ncbi:MAG: AAA family ATPase [Spirochaetaceae bacterium]|nr:AAA family ATPase [Spirochaetaceae bacterium]
MASLRATSPVSLFVTGSNSRLLSGELASLLMGRTVEFEVPPFSLAEMRQDGESIFLPKSLWFE